MIWNGLKLLSIGNYLDAAEMGYIKGKFNTIDSKSFVFKKKREYDHLENLNPYMYYAQDLFKHIDLEGITNKNKLRVIIDTGAGTGKFVTPQILRETGCSVNIINDDLLVKNNFPREIEPIEKNLKDLIMEVWQGNFDVGFAHDCDADRLAIIGENGICFPEDVGLALIAEYYLKNKDNKAGEVTFITNLASSLMFDVIAEKYNVEVKRTQIGEVFLVEKMHNLLNDQTKSSKNRYIFGGEGSCGGAISPFNLTRDGLYAAAKIIEILVDSGEKISNLVARLPKFFSHRRKIRINRKNVIPIISGVKQELINEGEEVNQIGNDLKFGKEKEWFILIHPSNTEPIIRVICEAKVDSLARIFCETTTELIKLVIENQS